MSEAGATPVRFSHLELQSFASRVMAAVGVREDEATSIARFLVEADLRGVDGHGVIRLLQYTQSIRGGHINTAPTVTVDRRSGATALVDADGGYGFTPATRGMRLAISLAATHGAGVVGVKNSHHFGIALAYALQAAEVGYVGIALSNTMAVLPAPNGLVPLVGNDPIAIAVPRPSGDPVAVDLALSEASWGKISFAAARGEPIPRGWAYDAQGRETTVAAEAVAANLLVPVGGAKGYALAVLFELLAGGLTGSPVGPAADGHSHRIGGCGHLLIALDPGRFGGYEVLADSIEQLERAVVSSPTSNGERPRLPGVRSAATRAQRLRDGIPVQDDVLAQLNELASNLEVARL